jgi:hypothetical protein
MFKRQRASYVRAEIGMGSDADEARWRKALEDGNTEELDELKFEEALRLAYYDERFGSDP